MLSVRSVSDITGVAVLRTMPQELRRPAVLPSWHMTIASPQLKRCC